jgi:hypothetical protein
MIDHLAGRLPYYLLSRFLQLPRPALAAAGLSVGPDEGPAFTPW